MIALRSSRHTEPGPDGLPLSSDRLSLKKETAS
jgi:hypothetical protein